MGDFFLSPGFDGDGRIAELRNSRKDPPLLAFDRESYTLRYLVFGLGNLHHAFHARRKKFFSKFWSIIERSQGSKSDYLQSRAVSFWVIIENAVLNLKY